MKWMAVGRESSGIFVVKLHGMTPELLEAFDANSILFAELWRRLAFEYLWP
jgi:hypothetical protein